MVLHEMGQVDESLQVFLHCLTIDEDFPGAKRKVEKVRDFADCFVPVFRLGILNQVGVVTFYW